MGSILNSGHLFHRSKARIKELGEVFTPEPYVEDMLNLLSKGKRDFWSNEAITFFEPSCGHGNIVITIYKKRLAAIYKKALLTSIKEPAYYAIANTINTLWAIDIDKKNIDHCRQRILEETIEFLTNHLKVDINQPLLKKKIDFFSHLLCAIKWHIHENEAISALNPISTAKIHAKGTKAGAKSFLKNGHNQLEFNLTWVKYFKKCEAENSIPIDFKRALHFIKKILAGNSDDFKDFEFMKYSFNNLNFSNPRKNNNTAQKGFK